MITIDDSNSKPDFVQRWATVSPKYRRDTLVRLVEDRYLHLDMSMPDWDMETGESLIQRLVDAGVVVAFEAGRILVWHPEQR